MVIVQQIPHTATAKMVIGFLFNCRLSIVFLFNILSPGWPSPPLRRLARAARIVAFLLILGMFHRVASGAPPWTAQPDNDRVYASDPAGNVDGFCLREAEGVARDCWRCWRMRLADVRRADEFSIEKSACDVFAQHSIEHAERRST